jgi:F0F1-type ATP synthase gamma subunit
MGATMNTEYRSGLAAITTELIEIVAGTEAL